MKEGARLDQTSLFALIGAGGTLSAVAFGFLGYKKGLERDSYHSGNDRGSIASDIEYIKRRTDDVLLEQKDTNKSINALAERVTRVEESAKSAHKRIDQIEEKKE
jgi:hypothetical protein